jgi:hypothetical protein
MGRYINQNSRGESLPTTGKAEALLNDGAKRVPCAWQKNLVCVVENGPFDAAGYAYCESEFKAFNLPSDTRRKTWLVYEHAERLAK